MRSNDMKFNVYRYDGEIELFFGVADSIPAAKRLLRGKPLSDETLYATHLAAGHGWRVPDQSAEPEWDFVEPAPAVVLCKEACGVGVAVPCRA
jgi:hypothetical protein